MRKVFVYSFMSLIMLGFSCSDDEKKPARMKLLVNGEPVEVNEVVMSRSVWSNDVYSVEQLEIFGKISKDQNLRISIEEYGVYDESGILHRGGMRPRIYQSYDQIQEDGEDCVYPGISAYCDNFYFYMPPFGGLYPYAENVIGHLEITAFDLEEKRIAGTFSITGNEMDNGPSFSITGEFDSSFRNSLQ